MNNISASIRTYVDLDLRIPGGILLPFVSYQNGLQYGNALDLSTLKVDAVAATELAFKIGRPIALPEFFDYLNLDKGAYGVGIKQILGHGYVALSADKNSLIEYDDSNNVKLDAKLKVVSAGTGINIAKQVGPGVDFFNKKDLERFNDEGWIDTKGTLVSKPVTGWGWGFDAGAIVHNDAHFVSVDMQDIGMIIWNGRETRRATLNLEGSTQKLTIDNTNGGGGEVDIKDYFGLTMTPDPDAADSRENLVTYLPMSLNLDYTYYYDLSDRAGLNILVKYLTANAGVKQQIVRGPGKNIFTPTLLLGGSAGVLKGVLPLRYGIIIGGPGKSSSVVSTGINTRYVSFDVYYKTIGHPFLIGKNGFEAASTFAYNWGYGKKKKTAEDIAAGRRFATLPDTADPYAKRLESAWALWRSAKARVDGVNAADTIVDAALSDTADPYEKRLDSAWTLWKFVKARIDSANAAMDVRDAAKKNAGPETLHTPHDREVHPAEHGHGHEPVPEHHVPVHDDASKKIEPEQGVR
jgi:hypothetical protein